MAESLYFYGRQFIKQGCLGQKFGVILHHWTVLWFFIENKVRIYWFQLQNLHGFVMAPGIINNKSENIFGILKTIFTEILSLMLKFGLSGDREQNIKNRRN